MLATTIWQKLTIHKNGVDIDVTFPVEIQLNGTNGVLYTKSRLKPAETETDRFKYCFIENFSGEKERLCPDNEFIWVRTMNGTVNVACSDAIDTNEGAVSQNYIEKNVKSGKQWDLSTRFFDIVVGGSCGIKFTTGAKPVIMKSGVISTTFADVDDGVLTGCTATEGDALPIYNLNNDLTTGPTLLSSAKLITNIKGGTPVFTTSKVVLAAGGGAGTYRTGNSSTLGLEKILKPNTDYYLRFENTGKNTAGDIGMYFTFYEGDYVV